MISQISVVIPIYRNTSLFLKNLAHNKPFLEECEIILVNDYPADSLDVAVKQLLPWAKLINHQATKGFGSTVNDGVSAATCRFVLLLNTDVTLNDSLFIKALEHFKKDSKLFAVSFAQRDVKNLIHGGNKGSFNHGFIRHSGRITNSLSPNLWAEGGSMICRKDLFVKFHGFDPLYAPFYDEDRDLSYIAWKCGYSVLFDPSVVVDHTHESTIKTYFQKTKINTIAHRNLFIFHWKNVTDTVLFYKHLVSLPRFILAPLFRGNISVLLGFLQALVRLPQIIEKRHDQEKYMIKTDVEVLNQFAQ